MDDKGVLILANRYNVDSSANGICIKNVANEMVTRGIKVIVISDRFNGEPGDEIINNVEVKKIPVAFSKAIQKSIHDKQGFLKYACSVINSMKKAISIIFYPDISPLRSRRLYMYSREIIEKEKINHILCVYRPYDTIKAGLLLKQKYKNKITLTTYHLDVLTSSNNKNGLISSIKKNKGRKAFLKETRTVDKMILPLSEKKDERFNRGDLNIAYADFPLFVVQKETKCELPYDDKCISLVYIGSLDKKNRNPIPLVELLEQIIQTRGLKIKVYIWGSIEKELAKELATYKFVGQYGIISNKFVPYAYKKANILINISNSITADMVPSKIFQLFSTGKPIINYVFDENDVSLPYFTEYRHSFNVLKMTRKENTLSELADYISYEKNMNYRIDEALFKYATPQYLVDEIVTKNKDIKNEDC